VGHLRYLILGLVIGFFLDGCSTPAAFTYKYYGLEAVSYSGNLLGPTAQQDLSLKLCEPVPATPTTPEKKGQCIVMLKPEFIKLKGDYLFMEKQLISCQQGITVE
jgi:hypothetical protein